jgi:hypothetical protein
MINYDYVAIFILYVALFYLIIPCFGPNGGYVDGVKFSLTLQLCAIIIASIVWPTAWALKHLFGGQQ